MGGYGIFRISYPLAPAIGHSTPFVMFMAVARR